ncbi:MAG: hypothetical protein ABSG16_06070 [Candidatus Acidiferrum sp.]|jgi:hypothetical protein
MNYTKTLFLFALLVAMTMTACSGLEDRGGGGGGGGGGTNPGDATLSFTLQATPLAAPPDTNILSYVLVVGGATLTPASGSVINIPGPFTFDMTRLESDSAFLGTASVPAGTYTSLTVSLTSASVTYCTVTTGVTGCAAGSVTQVSGGATASVITFPNGGLVLSSSQQAGLSVDFNLAATLTVSNAGAVTAVNLAPTMVGTTNPVLSTITLGSTHPSSLTSTQLDYLEDVTGNVTSVSGNIVTVKTATYGSIAATANSNTFYSPNCNTLNLGLSIACAQVNQVASINATLNADGTITLISYDPISAASATNNDWLEGVVTYNPTNSAQFNIVVNDADVSNSGTLLPTTIPIGAPVTVKYSTSNTPVFGVDTQGLNVPADYTNFQGTLPATSLLPGQAVAVHVTNYSSTGGNPTGILVTTDAVEIRFSRVAGTAAVGGNTISFSLSSASLPTYFGLTTASQLVELTSGTPPSTNSTNYDGVSSPTSIVSGDTYSIRALYFGQFDAYPFVAAKVRQNP